MDSIDEVEQEIKAELEVIHQQRSTSAINMDEIDQSNDLVQNTTLNVNSKSTNNSGPISGVYNCLAATQKREQFEKMVKESKGSFYFYQLDDETNSFLDPL